MKYYSEKTNKIYDDEKSLVDAEKAFEEKELAEKAKRENRAKRAKEVEDAYKHAEELLNKFIKDYGSYHTSVTTAPLSFFDLIDRFFY